MDISASSTPQKAFCHLGELGALPDEMLFITRMPESADVTKNTAIMTMPSTHSAPAMGNWPKKLKSSMSGWSARAERAPPATWLSMWMAPAPNTVIHMNTKSDGTSSTATMYSRMVRPFDMRAMNSPTNGAQLIHHAQNMTVQLVNHPRPSVSKANVLNVRPARRCT